MTQEHAQKQKTKRRPPEVVAVEPKDERNQKLSEDVEETLEEISDTLAADA